MAKVVDRVYYRPRGDRRDACYQKHVQRTAIDGMGLELGTKLNKTQQRTIREGHLIDQPILDEHFKQTSASVTIANGHGKQKRQISLHLSRPVTNQIANCIVEDHHTDKISDKTYIQVSPNDLKAGNEVACYLHRLINRLHHNEQALKSQPATIKTCQKQSTTV